LEVQGHGEVVDILEDVIKLHVLCDDGVFVLFENGDANKKWETRGQGICPENLPQKQDLVKGKLSLEIQEQPPEAEKHVQGILLLYYKPTNQTNLVILYFPFSKRKTKDCKPKN
jgi:hypothetical protein